MEIPIIWQIGKSYFKETKPGSGSASTCSMTEEEKEEIYE